MSEIGKLHQPHETCVLITNNRFIVAKNIPHRPSFVDPFGVLQRCLSQFRGHGPEIDDPTLLSVGSGLGAQALVGNGNSTGSGADGDAYPRRKTRQFRRTASMSLNPRSGMGNCRGNLRVSGPPTPLCGGNPICQGCRFTARWRAATTSATAAASPSWAQFLHHQHHPKVLGLNRRWRCCAFRCRHLHPSVSVLLMPLRCCHKHVAHNPAVQYKRRLKYFRRSEMCM